MIKHVFALLACMAAGVLAVIAAFMTGSFSGHAEVGLLIGAITLLAITPIIGNANPRGIWYVGAAAGLPLAWLWLEATNWGRTWWSLPGLVMPFIAAYGGAMLGSRKPPGFRRP